MARKPADLLLLLAYGFGFWLTRGLAAYWDGKGFYSVGFPAAGLRLAFLWHAGPRLTPAIAVVEVMVNLIIGRFSTASLDLAMTLWGILRPVLAYGGVIALTRVKTCTRKPQGKLANFSARSSEYSGQLTWTAPS